MSRNPLISIAQSNAFSNFLAKFDSSVQPGSREWVLFRAVFLAGWHARKRAELLYSPGAINDSHGVVAGQGTMGTPAPHPNYGPYNWTRTGPMRQDPRHWTCLTPDEPGRPTHADWAAAFANAGKRTHVKRKVPGKRK